MAETYPEPVTLVFFGDHIPPFGEEIYAELGLSTADEESHLTPYFIWTNTQNQPSRLNLNAWQLGAQALLAAGQLDDPFLSYVEMLRQEGKDMDAAYDLFSYDALFGKQYAYAEGGLTPRNETFQIGGSMALSGFDAARIGSLVYLRPRLAHPDQAFKLSINGCISDIPALSANAENLELQCVIPRYNGLPYNQSGVLCYPDAQALLEHSGELPVRAIPLPNCSPDDTRGSLTLYRTRDPIPSCYFAVLTLAGEPLDWQPPYGLTHSRQYAMDEDGTLLIALSASDASLLPTLTLHLLGE